MTEDQWRNRIDDYHTSIQAIVGFANFYVWNPATKADRDGVIVFQGRRLTRKQEKAEVQKESDPGSDQTVAMPTSEAIKGEALPVVPDAVAESSNTGSAKVTVANAAISDATTDSSEVVTPDLGIVTVDGNGVLAEVKISFPKNEAHWFDDFAQLMSYDAEFEGWPTQGGTSIAPVDGAAFPAAFRDRGDAGEALQFGGRAEALAIRSKGR